MIAEYRLVYASPDPFLDERIVIGAMIRVLVNGEERITAIPRVGVAFRFTDPFGAFVRMAQQDMVFHGWKDFGELPTSMGAQCSLGPIRMIPDAEYTQDVVDRVAKVIEQPFPGTTTWTKK